MTDLLNKVNKEGEVCLITPEGKQIPISKLKPGDVVLAYVKPPGKGSGSHFGTKYDGFCLEV